MVLSDSRQFIFLHIPRTAGISVQLALRPWNDARDLDFSRAKWEPGYPHYTGSEIREFMGEDRFSRYFKFAFVRNPWERIVSRYFYLKQFNTAPERLRNARGYLPPGNLTFLDWLKGRSPACIHPLDLRPQSEWLVVNGRNCADHIGRFERLAEEFLLICRKIGIVPNLSRTNVSEHNDYRSYYDAEAQAMVGSIFRSDVETWGYEF